MRMWEILEKHDDYRPYRDHEREYDRDYEYSHKGRMSRKSSEHDYKKMLTDAYDCGFETGYREAMEEAEHHYSKLGEKRMK